MLLVRRQVKAAHEGGDGHGWTMGRRKEETEDGHKLICQRWIMESWLLFCTLIALIVSLALRNHSPGYYTHLHIRRLCLSRPLCILTVFT